MFSVFSNWKKKLMKGHTNVGFVNCFVNFYDFSLQSFTNWVIYTEFRQIYEIQTLHKIYHMLDISYIGSYWPQEEQTDHISIHKIC